MEVDEAREAEAEAVGAARDAADAFHASQEEWAETDGRKRAEEAVARVRKAVAATRELARLTRNHRPPPTAATIWNRHPGLQELAERLAEGGPPVVARDTFRPSRRPRAKSAVAEAFEARRGT